MRIISKEEPPMKRNLLTLICLLVLSCLLTAHAEESSPAFTFLFDLITGKTNRNAEDETPPGFTFLLDGMDAPITLSTTPKEAVALLGEGAQYSEETVEPLGDFFTIINDSGLRFAGVECMRVVLSYYNDELLMLSFYITENALPDAQPLIDEMNLRYGEGKENPIELQEGELFHFSPPADRTWTCGEDIAIEYYYDTESSAFAHMFCIMNLPAQQKLEDASTQFMFSAQSESNFP